MSPLPKAGSEPTNRYNARINVICATCGASVPWRKGKKYCSPKCRMAGYQKRAAKRTMQRMIDSYVKFVQSQAEADGIPFDAEEVEER